MKRPFWIVFIVVFLCFFAAGAWACEDVWAQHDKIARSLEKNYGEVPVALAVTDKGNIATLFASEKTWTIVLTKPDGCALPLMSGYGWEDIKGKGGEQS